MSGDLISILLPTRNRPALVRLAVEAALAGADDDCEIVVVDNSDQALDLPFGDRRLRHIPPTGRVLSMPDNWERALEVARGDWIMIQGDKHMLVPGAVSALRRLARDSSRIIRFASPQDVSFVQGISLAEAACTETLRRSPGLLTIRRPRERQGELSSSEELRRILAIAGLRFAYPRHSPMFYTALVHRGVVEGIRKRCARVFVGSCPDVSSCLQLLATSERYLATQLPVVMTQYPNADGQWWSTGGSFMAAGPGADRFEAEFTQSPLSGRGLPPLVTAAVLESMLAFLESRPDVEAALGWRQFAKAAAREIEERPWRQRVRLHWQLARFLLRTGGAGGSSVLAQLEATLGVRAPRGLARPLVAARQHLGDRPAPEASSGTTTSRFENPQAALSFLATPLGPPCDASRSAAG